MVGPGIPGAKYRCRKCKHEYECLAGPTQCPLCQHMYVDWLNYEEMFR